MGWFEEARKYNEALGLSKAEIQKIDDLTGNARPGGGFGYDTVESIYLWQETEDGIEATGKLDPETYSRMKKEWEA